MKHLSSLNIIYIYNTRQTLDKNIINRKKRERKKKRKLQNSKIQCLCCLFSLK